MARITARLRWQHAGHWHASFQSALQGMIASSEGAFRPEDPAIAAADIADAALEEILARMPQLTAPEDPEPHGHTGPDQD